MKQKKIFLVLVLAFLVGLSGCAGGIGENGEQKPHKMWSEESIDACYSAISVVQEVLDGTMDADTAENKLEGIKNCLEPEDEEDDTYWMYNVVLEARIEISAYMDDNSTSTRYDLEKKIIELEDALYNGYDIPDPPEETDPKEYDLVELYSDEYVTIYYSHCEKDDYHYPLDRKYKIFFSVDNKTDFPVSIYVDSLSVGGFDLPDPTVFMANIEPNSEKAEVIVYSNGLKSLTPVTASGSFHINVDRGTTQYSNFYTADFNCYQLKEKQRDEILKGNGKFYLRDRAHIMQ